MHLSSENITEAHAQIKRDANIVIVLGVSRPVLMARDV